MYRAIKGYFPEELKPLYDFLQNECNEILSSTKYKKDLEALDVSMHRGHFWKGEIKALLAERVEKWEIANKQWYSYIVFENIRRTLESLREKREIWELLKFHDNKITTELREDLTKRGLYPTGGRLKNLQKMKEKPSLPNGLVFELDYSISAEQNFKYEVKENKIECQIQMFGSKEWLEYNIHIPTSISEFAEGKVAKPCFLRTKSGDYATMSYQVKPKKLKKKFKNVLGVDLGLVKIYSAGVVSSKGELSEEYIASKRLTANIEKYKRLERAGESIDAKFLRKVAYGIDEKLYRLADEALGVYNKMRRVKRHQSKMVASDLINLATIKKCKVINFENLSWVENKGGSWNFSEIQHETEILAELHGIKIQKVNASYTSSTNPVTGERGITSGRIVTFKDGFKIDRDNLAWINIGLRKPKGGAKKLKKLPTQFKTIQTPKRPSRKNVIRKDIQEFLKIKENKLTKPKDENGKVIGGSQIVLLSPNKLFSGSRNLNSGIWRHRDVKLTNSSLMVKGWTKSSTL